MNEILYNDICLTRACTPDLKAGKYKILAQQSLETPKARKYPAVVQDFYVNCQKFTVAPESIYSLYPDRDSKGNYENVLPHIVFESQNLPWERSQSDTEAEPYPWMALVCFSNKELPVICAAAAGDMGNQRAEDIFFPDLTFDESSGENPDTICEYMDVEAELLEQVFPREEEVPLLTHVRKVRMHEKEDEITGLDGVFSVVSCNRFPVSSGEGEKNTLCLVSLEGYRNRLPGGSSYSYMKTYKAFRFAVLYRWDIHSVSKAYPGFRVLLEQMDTKSFHAPFSQAGGDPEKLSEILKRGYVPLPHTVRTGEKAVSFYRGPFVPCTVERQPARECTSADGELRYDPVLGMLDVSYGAAWQLGRMLALKNQSVACLIYQWRRGMIKNFYLRTERKLLIGKLMESQELMGSLRQKKRMVELEADSVETGFLTVWAELLSHEIITQQSVTPLGDPMERVRREDIP